MLLGGGLRSETGLKKGGEFLVDIRIGYVYVCVIFHIFIWRGTSWQLTNSWVLEMHRVGV